MASDSYEKGFAAKRCVGSLLADLGFEVKWDSIGTGVPNPFLATDSVKQCILPDDKMR